MKPKTVMGPVVVARPPARKGASKSGAEAPTGRRRAGGYLAAGVLHALLLLFPVYGLFLSKPGPPPKAVEVRLARSDVPVTEEPRETPETRLAVDTELETALAGVEADAPFQEALGKATSNQIGAIDARAFGLDPGAGAGRGRGGGGGPSAASQGAVHEGLEWLVRHQSRDGSWGPAPYRLRRVGDDCDNGARSRRLRRGQVGHTGLALLCFLAAKQGPEVSGPYQAQVKRAEQWLLSQITRYGSFRVKRESRQTHFYQHAIGTLALAECLARRDRPQRRQAVQGLVRFLERTRGTFGWRYGGNACDTSVLAWVILALKGAEHAGVEVKPASYQAARGWLKRVTSRAGCTGYQAMYARNGAGMTATGLFLRVLLGESTNSRTNELAAKRVGKLRVDLQRGEPKVTNLYAVYYSALAMFQVGGRRWRAFNPRIRDGLVAAQSKSDDCTRGSWDGNGWVRGRILATCFATLTLETYYRYLRPRAGSVKAEAALEAALARLERVSSAKQPTAEALRGAEQALLGALAKLEIAGYGWESIGDARAGLVKLAHLQADHTKARLYTKAYWRALPEGGTVDPFVVGATRLAQLQANLSSFQRATAAAKSALEADAPAVARAAHWQLLSARRELKVGLASVPPGRVEIRRRVRRLLSWSEELLAALTFHDVDTGITHAIKIVARTPAKGRVGPLERRLLGELAGRANLQLDIARTDKDAEALRLGVLDLKLIEARRPARLTRKDAAQLIPVLRRARLSRIAALVALNLHRPALSAADAFLEGDPGDLAPQAQRLVRQLLQIRFQQGKATKAERKRLLKLVALEPNPTTEDQLLLASIFLSLDHVSEADDLLVKALATRSEGEDLTPVLLARAKIALRSGRVDDATARLDELPPAGRRRLEVALLRAAIQRRKGRYAEALTAYKGLLGTLSKKPKAWWEVAEAAVRTYYESGEPAAGRRFIERLRTKDIALGGRPGLLAIWNRKGWAR